MSVTTLVDNFEGKKLNAPNDLVFRSDGTLFFTDPPYGLPRRTTTREGAAVQRRVQAERREARRHHQRSDAAERDRVFAGRENAVRGEFRREAAHLDALRRRGDGTVSNGRVFFDATADKDGGLPDGMKIDVRGNLWATGPSAVFVFSPDGTHLGTIKPPEDPANCGWGDDGRTLYITAETGLYRIKTSVMGQKPVYSIVWNLSRF